MGLECNIKFFGVLLYFCFCLVCLFVLQGQLKYRGSKEVVLYRYTVTEYLVSIWCIWFFVEKKQAGRKIANVGNNFSSAPLKGQEKKKEKRERMIQKWRRLKEWRVGKKKRLYLFKSSVLSRGRKSCVFWHIIWEPLNTLLSALK